MRTFPVSPVHELRNSVHGATSFQAAQEVRVAKWWCATAANIYKFSKSHSSDQVNMWLSELNIKPAKKSNPYTNVVALAFATPSDGESSEINQQIKRYSAICLALDHFSVSAEDAEDFLLNKTLNGLLRSFYDEIENQTEEPPLSGMFWQQD